MQHPDTDTQFESQLVALAAGNQPYLVAGPDQTDEPPLLYIHGAGGLLVAYPFYELAENRQLYLPTLPGFDGTDYLDGIDTMPQLAAHMADFIETALGGKTDVIAHSFGGWLACWLAANHPDRIGRLVLECPAGFRASGEGGMSENPIELARALFKYRDKVPPDPRPKEVIRGNRWRPHHYHDGIPLDEALVAKLGNITASTRLILSDADSMIPPETGEILGGGIPDCEVITVHDTAHYVHVDEPELYRQLVERHLAQ